MPSATRLKFWGVRGSIPVPGSSTLRYGGNTSCIEIRADDEIIVLDAGSGLRLLGLALEEEFGARPIRVTLLLSHTHWDHIQGLPFFSPAYQDRNSLRVLGYEGARKGLAAVLASQMETSFFPVNLHDMPSAITIEELKGMDFAIGPVQVHAMFMNHPGICAGYRLETSAGSIAFLPDNEPDGTRKLSPATLAKADRIKASLDANHDRKKLIEFVRGADVLIMDAQYTDEEYAQKVGWGHGSLSSVVSLAVDAEVPRLFLFHHDPGHDDTMLDEIVARARRIVGDSGKIMEVDAAREEGEVWLGLPPARQ